MRIVVDIVAELDFSINQRIADALRAAELATKGGHLAVARLLPDRYTLLRLSICILSLPAKAPQV